MLLNCTFKTRYDGEFYGLCIFQQLKNRGNKQPKGAKAKGVWSICKRIVEIMDREIQAG